MRIPWLPDPGLSRVAAGIASSFRAERLVCSFLLTSRPVDATLLPMRSWPTRSLALGGDYNPEQWPREVWDEDVRLMREAGVTVVTVGVFAWSLLEPEPGQYSTGWLDEVLDLLHANDIAVDLATATASPPAWMPQLDPEVLPQLADGSRLWPGGRQAYCPSSSTYREHALRLVEMLATRYHGHPALAMWHVNNEY